MKTDVDHFEKVRNEVKLANDTCSRAGEQVAQFKSAPLGLRTEQNSSTTPHQIEASSMQYPTARAAIAVPISDAATLQLPQARLTGEQIDKPSKTEIKY